MRRAGMMGIALERLFKNCCSRQLIGEALVRGRRERGNGVAVEDLGLRIIRIVDVDLLQRVLVGAHALTSVSLICVPVKGLGSADVGLLARRLRAEGFGLLHETPTLLQRDGAGPT